MKLHSDEVETSAALVEALLADQFPHWASLPVRPFASIGTVNAIFRIGDDLYARLPRVERHVEDLHRELEWLPRLAPALSLAIPELVALGAPGHGYPFDWAIVRWLEGAPYAGTRGEGASAGGVDARGERASAGSVGTRGEDASAGGGGADARETAMAANDRAAVATKDGAAAAANDGAAVAAPGVIADERVAAADLARFVREIRGVPVTPDAPRGGRAPLRELDGVTRDAIARSRDVIDVDAALVAWERALTAPPHTGPPVWIHGDLLRPNLLVRAGRLSAVLDFGAAGVGDPAADLVAAWAVFTAPGRERFREALDVDDGTWARARGYALHQAALIIPYYAETNPEFVAHARRTVEQVLGDLPQREAGCLPTVRLLR